MPEGSSPRAQPEPTSEGRASDVNFHRLICSRKDVCEEEEVAGKGDDELFTEKAEDDTETSSFQVL